MTNQLGVVRAILAACLVSAALPASAQSVRLDQYRAAETPEDGFAVSRPDDLGHLRFGARLDLDYSLNPLVYQFRGSDPTTEVAPIVEHLLAMNVGLSFGLADRIVIFAGMPFNLVMDGTQVMGQPRADGSSIGDVYLGVRGRLFGEEEDAFALSLQVTGTAPTANAARFQSRFAGEAFFTLQPEILMEVRAADVIRITGNVGAIVREEQDFGSLRVNSEFTWALGVYAALVKDVLDLAVETYGSTAFVRFGEGQVTPWEIIGGLLVQPVPGLHLNFAAGTGMVRGYGSGDFRAVLTVGYATPGEAEDRDSDGIADDRDECPDEPEDADQFEDENGCPDPDNDRDGVNDPEDQCDDQPEDADGLQDEDGCPEEDADGDGVADTGDRCPSEAGMRGAPRPECEGCPSCEETPVETGPTPEPTQTTLSIPDRVYFDTNNDQIRPTEQRALDNVAQWLAANPGARVIVEGHADHRGEEPTNVHLSRGRARRVARRLQSRGVPASRLVIVACGELYPADSGGDLQVNRRVEFHVIDAGEGVRSGCVEIR
jgi:outer membrane protein OmpA-like peptidoglycan-associated protein